MSEFVPSKHLGQKEILQRLCQECIDHSNLEQMSLALERADEEDQKMTLLMMGQVSSAMIYKVLIPSIEKLIPEMNITQKLAGQISDADVMAEIFSAQLDTNVVGFRPLIEGVTRNRLKARYILEQLANLK